MDHYVDRIGNPDSSSGCFISGAGHELENTLMPHQLADPDSYFATVNGIQVHYKIAGEGKPALLLLHGFASSLFSWREVMPVLSQDNQVLAYDRPAFGLTERPMTWQSENPYSAEYQVKLLIALMDQLNIQKAVLVGNSAGGAIAMSAALQYPERAKALVLVDPAVDQAGSPAWMRPLFNNPVMNYFGPRLVRRIQTWGRNLGAMAWHDPSKLSDAIWAGYTRPLQAENWDRGLWYFTTADQDLHLNGQLARLQLPVLVITGDDDRIVPTKKSIRLAGELPQGELVVVLDSGHVPHEECPQAFLQAVQAFLEKIKEQ